MKRFVSCCFFLLLFTIFLVAEDSSGPYEDNISRLELLGFHYFAPPLALSPGRIYDKEGRAFLINGETEQVMIIVFLNNDDPFASDLRKSLEELSEAYEEEPLMILTLSSAEQDFKDRQGRTADKWGVQLYPTILIVDHQFRVRGSSEGIYPDINSEDFRKVLDELLLDVKTPGIINPLQ
ncbi:MAG: hypothetical protein PQJ60_07945 [Spirochaetales bacterium]|nr:hypothetical protein [Spirochaetales bacterium]